VICITEGIPVRDMIVVRDRIAGKSGARCCSDRTVRAVITPEEIKIGSCRATSIGKGALGSVSRSGTLTYEAVAQITDLGLGSPTAVGIGGDPVNGLKHVDVLQLFNDDPDTDAVVMIGEIGGSDEETAARWVHEHMDKPGSASSPAPPLRPASGWAMPARSSRAGRARPRKSLR